MQYLGFFLSKLDEILIQSKPNQKLRARGRCHDGQNRYTKYLAKTSFDPNADVRVPTGDVVIRLP